MELIWREIWWKNSNFILVVNGMPGRGKSKFAQYVMWSCDRDPTTGRPRASLLNWTTSKQMFAQAVDRCSGDRGRAICWEEPNIGGVARGGTNARRFMSNDNLQISTLFQTFRHNNHLIILTLPAKASFDSQAREVAHAVVNVLHNNGEYSTSQFYTLDMNPIFGKTYIKNLKFLRDGRLKTLRQIYCGLPPESFGKLCDEKSDWAKRDWRKQIAETNKPISKELAITYIDKFKALVLSNPIKFQREFRGRMVWDKQAIAKTVGCTNIRAVEALIYRH